MKKLMLFITVSLFATIVQAQGNSVKPTKEDSLKQVEANKIVQEIITKTPIKDFQEWLYKTMPADKYDEFKAYYTAFIQLQYNERLKPKKP